MKDVETEFRHRGSPDSMLSSPLVSDGFDRFKLWAGNIGAIHVPNRQDSSLDQRLKEAPTVADEVIACLKALIANLDDGKSSLRFLEWLMLIDTECGKSPLANGKIVLAPWNSTKTYMTKMVLRAL